MKMLKPRVQPLRATRGAASPTPRMTGRRLQARNARLFARNPLCKDCRAEGIATPVEEWDHEIPLAVGGKDDESNLVGLCRPHHAKKTERDRVRYGLSG